MSKLINGMTQQEYNFMFSDPIYPEDMYSDDPDKLAIHDLLLEQDYEEGEV